jgi:hypothetical protein
MGIFSKKVPENPKPKVFSNEDIIRATAILYSVHFGQEIEDHYQTYDPNLCLSTWASLLAAADSLLPEESDQRFLRSFMEYGSKCRYTSQFTEYLTQNKQAILYSEPTKSGKKISKEVKEIARKIAQDYSPKSDFENHMYFFTEIQPALFTYLANETGYEIDPKQNGERFKLERDYLLISTATAFALNMTDFERERSDKGDETTQKRIDFNIELLGLIWQNFFMLQETTPTWINSK